MRGLAACPLAALVLAASVAADEATARNAFVKAYAVLTHPRCLNCHPAGDRPLQGDESVVHAQRVQRGRDGRGRFAMKCFACHQASNTPGEHMPPGAPNWHLPAASMKLVFEGRSVGQLCRQLKDPKQNGGKTLAQLQAHVSKDPLVAWGWQPGDGRMPVPGTQAELGAHFATWIANGAVCPE